MGLSPSNSLLAQSAHAAISTILGPDVHGARRPRPVVDARQAGGVGPPTGGPTAPLTIETRETKVRYIIQLKSGLMSEDLLGFIDFKDTCLIIRKVISLTNKAYIDKITDSNFRVAFKSIL